jgi:hypothetical protein
LALASAAALCAISGFARGEVVDCKPVFDAMLRVATTPYHAFTTLNVNGKSIVAEQINDGKKIYVLVAKKWSVSPMTPQDMLNQENENIQNTQSSCTLVREESVDGTSATLYSTHEERDGVKTNGQVWVSKATGLPLRVKSDTPTDTRYVFTGVSAPDVR